MSMKAFGRTTGPVAASTGQSAGDVPVLALVLAWSKSEPERVGEVAFFPLGEWLTFGRGGVENEKFAYFFPQRPGEVPAVELRDEILRGTAVSRCHGAARFTGDTLEVNAIGKNPTYFNGEARASAVLRPGDTLMVPGELVLLCVSRPRVLPAVSLGRPLHAFGEPDPDGIVGESPAAWAMRAQLARAAQGSKPVLIRGESGTGKLMAAAIVHRGIEPGARPLCLAQQLRNHVIAQRVGALRQPGELPERRDARPQGPGRGGGQGDAFPGRDRQRVARGAG